MSGVRLAPFALIQATKQAVNNARHSVGLETTHGAPDKPVVKEWSGEKTYFKAVLYNSAERCELAVMKAIGCNLTVNALNLSFVRIHKLAGLVKRNPVVEGGLNDVFAFFENDTPHCFGDGAGELDGCVVRGTGR